ncbi:hypothetical protein [uncultured Deinococcus sp.]|uniref:hypothetical protein n=1 Tax=uncultured Deinococcus sp. TaxID=158789 RepID=UPI0025F4A308|nr:hypothetical protein [uncultured Deinococcus sp.]
MTLPLQADLAQVALYLGQQGELPIASLRTFLPRLPGSTLMGFLAGLHAAGAVDIGPDAVVFVRPDGEDLLRRAFGVLAGGPTCRVCGCAEEWGCAEGCTWVEADLCSACAEADGEERTSLDQARYALNQAHLHPDDAGTRALVRRTLDELGGAP